MERRRWTSLVARGLLVPPVMRTYSFLAVGLVLCLGSGCGSVSSRSDGGSGGETTGGNGGGEGGRGGGPGGNLGEGGGQGGLGGAATGQGGQAARGGAGGQAGLPGTGGNVGGSGGLNLSCNGDSDCGWHTVGCCSEVCAATAPPPTVICNIACAAPQGVCACVDHQCTAEAGTGGHGGAGGSGGVGAGGVSGAGGTAGGCGTCPDPTDSCTSCNTCCPRGALCVCPAGGGAT
jgi:hypothetical protein